MIRMFLIVSFACLVSVHSFSDGYNLCSFYNGLTVTGKLDDSPTSDNSTSWGCESDNTNTSDPCEPTWHGITCTGELIWLSFISWSLFTNIKSSRCLLDDGRVEKVHLFEFYLAGTISSQLGNMAVLKSLQLHSNLLVGTIPVQLSQASSLTELHLNDNEMTGSIPTEFKNPMQYLYLYKNSLSGSIPSTLPANLVALDINNNRITGIHAVITQN